jgi:hypothetical protein
MANFEFRMETETSSVGKGRYRTPKVGIGRLKSFQEETGIGNREIRQIREMAAFWVGLEWEVEVSSSYQQLAAVGKLLRVERRGVESGSVCGVLSRGRAEGCRSRGHFGCNGLLDSDSRKPHFSCLAVRRDSAGPTNL